MAGVQGITVFKCVATPSMKWCHVLQRVDFEAKTRPNLVPRVVRCWNVWPNWGHILGSRSDVCAPRNVDAIIPTNYAMRLLLLRLRLHP